MPTRTSSRIVLAGLGAVSLLSLTSVARSSIVLDAADDYALNALVTNQVDTYQGLTQFDASKAVNGNVTEPNSGGEDSGQNEWLANNGVTDGSFTIDLGASKSFTEIDLYNTHNGTWNDRGTNAFTITGSNALDSNLQPASPVTILTGSLPQTNSQASITPDVFTSLQSNGPFRYIQFSANTFYGNGAGLNEIAIGVPEPMSGSLIGMTVAALFLRRHPRK